MRRLIVLFLLVCAVGFCTVGTQVVGERHALQQQSWQIYQPTQKGDWFRWDIMTALAAYKQNEVCDSYYPCIQRVVRGNVYEGASVLHSAADSTTGSFGVADGDWSGYKYCQGGGGASDTKTFNVPGGFTPTHVRVFFITSTSAVVANQATISYLEADNTLISVSDTFVLNNIPGQHVAPCIWQSVPASTGKIKVGGTAASAFWGMCGVQWINTDNIVSPDTAGSLMFDGDGGNCYSISNDNDYGAGISPASNEIAIYWAKDGEAFDSVNKTVGGLAHKGITTDVSSTVTWSTQSGNDAAAASDIMGGAWATYKGQKELADYVILTLDDLLVTTTTDPITSPEEAGRMYGSLTLDVGGCSVWHKITSTQDMDVFQVYSIQLTTSDDVRYCWFGNDPTRYTFADVPIYSSVNIPSWRLEAPASRTIYSVNMMQPELLNYGRGAIGTGAQIRINDSEKSPKVYANLYYNSGATTTKQFDMDTGEVIETRFRIDLMDSRVFGSISSSGSGSSGAVYKGIY